MHLIFCPGCGHRLIASAFRLTNRRYGSRHSHCIACEKLRHARKLRAKAESEEAAADRLRQRLLLDSGLQACST